MSAIAFKLEPIEAETNAESRIKRRRARRVWYDPRQCMFPFDWDMLERRMPRLRLDEMSIEACREMWWQVLRMGIGRFMADDEGSDGDDDREWLLDDSDGVGSFIYCCHVCGVDDARLRRRLLESV